MPSNLARVRVVVAGHEYVLRPKAGEVIDVEAWKRKMRGESEAPRPTGNFRVDALAYLAAVRAMPSYRDRKRDIGLWADEFGDLPRAAIAPAMIRAVRDRWLTEGPRMRQVWKLDPVTKRKVRHDEPVKAPLSASTVNHRLRALENLYTVLDGRHSTLRNPVREVPEADEDALPVRVIPVASIRALLACMPDSQAKARLAVLAWTGIPPEQMRQITPDMLDTERRVVWVPRRKKGKGSAGRWLPLTTDGLAAFRLLKREGAFEAGDWRPVNRAFHRAVKRYKKATGDAAFDGLTSYALRKAIAARLYQASSDFDSTRRALGHSSPKTTAIYAAAALDPQLTRAVKRLEEAERGRKVSRPKRKTGHPRRNAPKK